MVRRGAKECQAIYGALPYKEVACYFTKKPADGYCHSLRIHGSQLVSGTTMTTMGQGPLWKAGWQKKIVKESHFNIFEIINVMPKEQATTDMKLDQLEDSAMQPSHKRRYVQWDERISTLFERFQNRQCNWTLGTIITGEYLYACILTYLYIKK